MRYGFPIFYLSLWVMFLVIPWSFVLFGRIAELLGYAVNSTYQGERIVLIHVLKDFDAFSVVCNDYWCDCGFLSHQEIISGD